MKKFVMGLIIGVGLTVAVSAAAEEIQSLIGKQVEGQVAVIVDGKEISVPAAIIDSVSYAPVRAVAEAVGKDVDWKEGKVILESKQATPTPSISESVRPTATPITGVYSKDRIETEIQRIEIEIHAMKGHIEQRPEKYDNDETRQKVSSLESELAIWKQRLAELDKQ